MPPNSRPALEALLNLRAPRSFASEWFRLTGVAIALVDDSKEQVHAWEAPITGRDLECVPAGATGRVSCRRGDVHLAAPVFESCRLVTGPLPLRQRRGRGGLSGERVVIFQHFLQAMGEEMNRFAAQRLDEAAPSPTVDFPELVGESAPFQEAREEMRRAAGSSYPVLIQGETGTGKDLASWLVHHRGARKDKPYVTVNCAAVPESLLESELFGHRRGAFTGADANKQGLFEAADGGTLFLDEMGEMPLATQAKLLRAIESGEFMPLGAVRSRTADVRILSATARDLAEMVRDGHFRADLFFRLRVLTVALPALRTVRGDLPAIARHCLQRIAERGGVRITGISHRASAALLAAPWPGNVRELIHELERATLRARGMELELEDLSLPLQAVAMRPAAGLTEMARAVAEAFERDLIRTSLERQRWNVKATAQMLKISRRALTEKLRRYELKRPKR